MKTQLLGRKSLASGPLQGLHAASTARHRLKAFSRLYGYLRERNFLGKTIEPKLPNFFHSQAHIKRLGSSRIVARLTSLDWMILDGIGIKYT